MLKIARMTMIAAAVALAMPAAAGSWPNLPRAAKSGPATVSVQAPKSIDGFIEEAGDSMSSLEQYRYFPSGEDRGSDAFASGRAPAPVAQAPAGDGFREVGGEPGWELSQHKYVLADGRFAHSDECDHAIRSAKAPTPQEVDALRSFSPGA